MHDHSHEHAPVTHVFSDATVYEQNLVTRQQLLHIATEIYKAGLNEDGRAAFSPESAAQRAHALIVEVDKIVVKYRASSYPPEV